MGTTALWLRLDRLPPAWDDAWYLTNSLVMFDALVSGGLAGYARQFLTILGTKPPLITVLPTPFYLLLGRDSGYAYGVNLCFIPVLLGAVYWIGRRFWTRRAGVLAACIVGTMPMLYGLARWYLIEFALAAWVCVVLALILRLLDSPTWRRGLCLGISLGLGMLLKVSFPVYVALPFLFLVAQFARGQKPAKAGESVPGRSGIVLAVFLPAILLPLPWYALNFRRTLDLALKAGFSEEADIYGTGDVFSIHAIKAYLVHLVNAGPSPYYAWLVFVLVLILILSPARRIFLESFSNQRGWLLFLWALPFLIFLFGRNKNVRYAAPFLPVLGLLAACALDVALRGLRKWGNAAAGAVLVFPLVAMLHTSFGVPGAAPITARGLVFLGRNLDYARMYDRNSWPHREILQAIAGRAALKPGARRIVLLGTDRAGFNANNFELAATEARLPLAVSTAAYETSREGALAMLDSASFFLYEEGGEGGTPYYNRFRDALAEAASDEGDFVEVACGIELPDGGRARVFKNLTQFSYLLRGEFLPAQLNSDARPIASFDGKVLLVEVSGQGEPPWLSVKMRWQCANPVKRDYWCFAHILDEQGNLLGFLDHQILDGEPPMTSWRSGDSAIEYLRYRLRPPFKGGTIRLRMGLYDRATAQRLRVSAMGGAAGLNLQLADNETALLVTPGTPGASKPESAGPNPVK